MNSEEIKTLDRHNQIIESLVKQSETLFNITSKLNGEYIKSDKDMSGFKIAFAKDLEFIKLEIQKGNKATDEVKKTLDMIAEGYVKREEFEARFRRLQDEIDGRIGGANIRIDSKTDTDKFDESIKNINKILGDLLDNQKWVTRIVVGGVVLTLLGTIFIK